MEFQKHSPCFTTERVFEPVDTRSKRDTLTLRFNMSNVQREQDFSYGLTRTSREDIKSNQTFSKDSQQRHEGTRVHGGNFIQRQISL